MDALAAIKATFFQECDEQLAELETGLLAVKEGDRDPELVNAIFRAVHSVKGGAGAFSLNELVRFAHVFETTLDEVRTGRLAPEGPIVDVMLRAADVLADLVHAARDGGTVDPARADALAAELAQMTNAPLPGSPEDEAFDIGFDFEPITLAIDDEPVELAAPIEPAGGRWTIRFAPKPALYAHANEPLLILRELGGLGHADVTIEADELPLLDALQPEAPYLAWRIALTTAASEAEIRDVFEFVDGDCELSIVRDDEAVADDAPPAPALPADGEGVDIASLIAMAQAAVAESAAAAPVGDPAPSAPALPEAAAPRDAAPAKSEPARPAETAQASAVSPTIRVDLDRVDRLIDLVGELVINQAMLSQRVFESGLARSSGVAVGLDDLELLTREIQDSVMAIRAQPVKSV
ncbi:MAG: Hpt domain-containing protein, partial [Methylobacteriaceae bacterium]|nr:Hpt domain-containing protein [Methylobacteriaceae bacterium]